MAHVGVYDSTHQITLGETCRVILETQHGLTVFTTENIREEISSRISDKSNKIDWVVKSADEPHSTFLSRVYDRSKNDVDLFYYNSLYGRGRQLFNYIRYCPNCPTILCIYNVNTWLRTGKRTEGGVKYRLNELLRKFLVRKIDEIRVEYRPIREYVRDKTGYSGKVRVYTPAIYEGGKKRTREGDISEDEPLTVTVPGIIDVERRNYGFVAEAFRKLFEKHGDRVKLIFLGPPSGVGSETVLDEIHEFEDSGYRVVYFDDWIPTSVFEDTLNKTDLIFSPLRKTIDKQGIVETYSKSKGSGNIMDGLRSATPIIQPQHLEVPGSVETSTVGYGSRSEFVSIVDGFVRNPSELDELKEKARKNSMDYTIEKQSNRFDKIVRETLT